MKGKKKPQKFIQKAEVIEVAQSPSIFRRITELRLPQVRVIPEKELIVGFVCGCMVVGIGFSSLRFVDSVKAYNAVLDEKQTLLKQKSYWQSVVTQFPDYRDAHFRLGVLLYQEGDRQQARVEVKKALQLDPLFVQGREFLARIEGK